MNPGDQLLATGYIKDPYPRRIRDTVASALASWQLFCALEQERKDACAIGDEDLNDIGYSMRTGTGTRGDRKEFFHVRSDKLDELYAIARKKPVGPRQNEVNDETARFILLTKYLIEELRPSIQHIGGRLAEEFSLPGFSRELLYGFDIGCTFRFIHYFPGGEAGKELAHAHSDKSALTLHLFESHPGLECLRNGTWHPMHAHGSDAFIIPGMALQYRSECTIKATCHRVVATRDSAKDGRYSLVCFIPLPNTPVYDVKNAPRLQDLEPGFNYPMPFSEFKTLFRDR